MTKRQLERKSRLCLKKNDLCRKKNKPRPFLKNIRPFFNEASQNLKKVKLFLLILKCI